MAIYANADTQRLTFKAGSNAKTSTSQYKIGYISDSMTVSVVNTTTAYKNIIGVIDTFQSSGSEALSVVVSGLGKVYMGTSCTAGDPLVANSVGNATPLTAYTITAIITGTAAISNTNVILGTALQGGITNGAMSCFVNTQKVFS